MNEPVVVKQKRKKNLSPPRGAGRAKKSRPCYSPADKLKAVRLRLEEGFSIGDVCAELGMAQSCLSRWVNLYRQFGEGGLQPVAAAKRPPKLPEPIHKKIIELKRHHPESGIKKISQMLRRWFFLPASPETVRRHLHAAELMPAAQPRKKRNVTRPRFFERATPNQMWQSDIFTFRLGGRYAYLVAFLDDYSRYLVGADLFRSPTAHAVIEVYRVAAGEFRPPKEMLTDNGRQYTSWRGTSRFEAELKKDHVAHFKSRPQHPMTLGKIERFWSTLWQDFLVRAQFESFESARERIKLWIKHYNHKRPNQGIDGLCPADRFFEIQHELRKTIEAGIQDNLLELALRGKPQTPFYMVGRLDGQSVVLRAEKGKLKLSVSDEQNQEQELVYDLQQTHADNGPQNQKEKSSTPDQCPGQGSRSFGRLDGTLQAGGCLPPVQGQLDDLQPLATPGHGGNPPSLGAPGQPGQGRSLESTLAGALAATTQPADLQTHPTAGTTPAEQDCHPTVTSGKNPVDEGQSQTTGGADLPSPLRPDDRDPGGPSPGHLPPAVLPVGTPGVGSPALGTGGSTDGTTQVPSGPGDRSTPTPGETTRATSPAL
jgi:transposase InsO family protein